MSSLAEYFALHRPKPKYAFGDRVEGTYKGIPFVGSAYTDNQRNELEGPIVSIHLDLPMKVGTEYLNYIRVKYKDIKGVRTCTKD
jgi:hypothetical protein